MKKTLVRLTVGMLIMLTLVSSIALGADTNSSNQTNNTGPNITISGTATGTVVPTDVPTPEETEQKVIPEKTIGPKPPKSPGFGSIITIATILSVVYIFGARRR